MRPGVPGRRDRPAAPVAQRVGRGRTCYTRGGSMVSVSLLMPVRNRAHLLDRVLGSLAENTTYPQVELVAVDDGSTDGSVDILRRWTGSGRLPAMKLIQSPNRGAIAALNTALQTASGEFC